MGHDGICYEAKDSVFALDVRRQPSRKCAHLDEVNKGDEM